MAIEAGEAGRGQGLVDRCPILHPGIAARHLPCELRELLGEIRIEQAGAGRAAAMVDQAENRPYAETAKLGHPHVMPGPVANCRVIGRHALPADGIPQRADPEARDGLKVGHAVVVPGLAELVAQTVTDAYDAAFQPPPEFGIWRDEGCGLRAERPRSGAVFLAEDAGWHDPP